MRRKKMGEKEGKKRKEKKWRKKKERGANFCHPPSVTRKKLQVEVDSLPSSKTISTFSYHLMRPFNVFKSGSVKILGDDSIFSIKQFF